ncbi:hypothetical protein TMS3_0107365 [Pseudomonas taeanensis MS-3]|uniref:Uncharacterized protein n=1 Tax=Pseudomonas taeanensis MS-3 TaxID=1395571 RepID=A0A0A1YR35_9PSED|nr:hypothetical protein [Pseudomonas taeanensis]KFX71728.1 hypothetical protein TMS3_0107365 [Pseudomonas taeanensis MS-3]
MLNRVFNRVFLIALLAGPMFVSASESARDLQAIRSKAFDVCNSAMLHFNPNVDRRDGGRDPRHAEEYRQSLKQLRGLVDPVRDTRLAAPLEIMETLLAELERLPSSDEPRYSHWLNLILQAHADLDNRAAQLYAAVPLSPAQESLDALSLNLARLDLLYQTRTFGALRFFLSDNSSDPFKALDIKIIDGFDKTEELWPNHSKVISTSRRNYYFVRRSLLEHGEDLVQESAAYYLGKITRTLNSLSLAQNEITEP